MKNAKIVAYGLLASLAVCVLPAMFNASESWYTIGGLGIWVFGVWASVILINNAPKD